MLACRGCHLLCVCVCPLLIPVCLLLQHAAEANALEAKLNEEDTNLEEQLTVRKDDALTEGFLEEYQIEVIDEEEDPTTALMKNVVMEKRTALRKKKRAVLRKKQAAAKAKAAAQKAALQAELEAAEDEEARQAAAVALAKAAAETEAAEQAAADRQRELEEQLDKEDMLLQQKLENVHTETDHSLDYGFLNEYEVHMDVSMDDGAGLLKNMMLEKRQALKKKKQAALKRKQKAARVAAEKKKAKLQKQLHEAANEVDAARRKVLEEEARVELQQQAEREADLALEHAAEEQGLEEELQSEDAQLTEQLSSMEDLNTDLLQELGVNLTSSTEQDSQKVQIELVMTMAKRKRKELRSTLKFNLRKAQRTLNTQAEAKQRQLQATLLDCADDPIALAASRLALLKHKNEAAELLLEMEDEDSMLDQKMDKEDKVRVWSSELLRCIHGS